jgi:DNA ligase D-like protein (predicted ligase)
VAAAAASLPEHVEPMLARSGPPFDSVDHLFEVKWDGVRAITYVDGGVHRMHGRRRRDLAARYPELHFLAQLPAGTVLDGELVVLQADGRPDFPGILSRENGSPTGAVAAARALPAVYVVFDLLYSDHAPRLAEPLRDRRERLQRLVQAVGEPRLVLSEGVVGDGLSLFEAVRSRGLEGTVGKRLDAPYRPGERSDAWTKSKPVSTAHCLILGYEPDGERDFRSLVIATDLDGELRCVGKVGSGLTAAHKQALRPLLFARRVASPLVATAVSGRWVKPELFCKVSFVERTAGGNLRAPVFLGLVDAGDRQ